MSRPVNSTILPCIDDCETSVMQYILRIAERKPQLANVWKNYMIQVFTQFRQNIAQCAYVAECVDQLGDGDINAEQMALLHLISQTSQI